MKVAILGCGVSGLISGWLLKKNKIDFKVFERQPYHGGMARTFDWHGFQCDIFSHRLFTKNKEILNQLGSVVPLIKQNRRSQIYIGGKWIKDPVNPTELVIRFFPKPGLTFVKDYLFKERLNGKAISSFDTYTLAKFGKSLNEFFFKQYTEKMFGIPADQISVEWARQKVRVSGFLDMIKKNTKIYFNYFHYPTAGGYGAFADKFYNDIKDSVSLHTTVKKLHYAGNRITAITYERDGEAETENFDIIISTLPITHLSNMLNFKVNLNFRPVTALYLLINKPKVSDNHWVYFGQKDVIINRMGEFKNFSDYEMPKDKTVLCCEITMDYPESNLADKAIADLDRIGFINKADVLDTKLIKENFGYPIYKKNFDQQVSKAMNYFSQFKNLFLLGRNAEFKHKEIDEIYGSALELLTRLRTSENLSFDNSKNLDHRPIVTCSNLPTF